MLGGVSELSEGRIAIPSQQTHPVNATEDVVPTESPVFGGNRFFMLNSPHQTLVLDINIEISDATVNPSHVLLGFFLEATSSAPGCDNSYFSIAHARNPFVRGASMSYLGIRVGGGKSRTSIHCVPTMANCVS